MQIQIGGQVDVGGPKAFLFLGIAVVFVVMLGAAYRLGFISTLGYESKTIHTGDNAFVSTKAGTTIGPKTLFLFEGQEVLITYNAEVKRGGLIVRMFSMTAPMNPDPDHRVAILEDGPGVARFPVRKTGLYKLVIEGTVLGADRSTRGYDVSYTVYWGFA